LRSRLAGFPFYPLVIGLYFPLFLYSRNLDRYSMEVAVVPTLAVGAMVLLVGILCGFLFKTVHRAAIGYGANLIFFFLYGGIFRTLKPMVPGGHKILLAAAIVLNAGLFLLYRKRKGDFAKWSPRLNTFALVLFALPVATLIRFHVQEGFDPEDRRHAMPVERITAGGAAARSRPDIYHIMMDAYSRADVLGAAYGFDNGPFLRALRDRGFQIATRGRANYSATDLSLASTLNMNFLDSLDIDLESQSRNWKKLEALRNEPLAVRFLKSKGYRWIVVPHGWENALPAQADAIRTPPAAAGGVYLTVFQNGLLSMTPIPYLLTALGMNELRRKPQHRNRILFEFDYLMHCAREPGPKYVFVHILAPHSPIVFGPKGEPKDDVPDLNRLRTANPALFRAAAMGELTYLNKRLLQAVDKIILATRGNCVILLHSDHGESVLDFSGDPRFLAQRHGVLSAIRLPGGAQVGLFHPGISNVNLFRFLFNHLFAAGYPFLPDRTWYSSPETPFQFREITGLLDSAEAAEAASKAQSAQNAAKE
jgi:hypothetical protein